MIADAPLGLALGQSVTLAGEPYRVVGLTQNALTSKEDSPNKRPRSLDREVANG